MLRYLMDDCRAVRQRVSPPKSPSSQGRQTSAAALSSFEASSAVAASLSSRRVGLGARCSGPAGGRGTGREVCHLSKARYLLGSRGGKVRSGTYCKVRYILPTVPRYLWPGSAAAQPAAASGLSCNAAPSPRAGRTCLKARLRQACPSMYVPYRRMGGVVRTLSGHS